MASRPPRSRAGAPVRARPLVRAVLTAAGAGVAVLADVAFDPAQRHVPLCPFHAATGWWCPLCGGLRAVDALAHLQVPAAVHDNLLVVAALPLVLLWWLDGLARAGSGRARRAWPTRITIGAVGLAVAFTVLRNLPMAAGLRPR